MPINFIYGDGDKFRHVYDTDCYTRGVLGLKYDVKLTNDDDIITKFGLKIDAEHNHLPDDDAEYIYLLHMNIINNIKK